MIVVTVERLDRSHDLRPEQRERLNRKIDEYVERALQSVSFGIPPERPAKYRPPHFNI